MGINIPELDTIGYEALREEAQANLAKDAPNWSDYNLSDPGITFLELFSWLSDIELYRLNRITPEHLKKFLALLGDHYPSSRPAKGVIVSTKSIDSSVRINKERVIELENKNKTKLFSTQHTFYGNPAQIKSIDVLGDSDAVTIRMVDNREISPFYAFGLNPKKMNYFRLNLNQMSSKRLKLYIELEESDLPSYQDGWKEDYTWLQEQDALSLEWYLNVNDQNYQIFPQEDCTLNLRYSGMISFILGGAIDEISTVSIECRLTNGAYMIAPFIKNIYLNTIEVVQAQNITQTNISSGESSQQLTLSHHHVIDTEGQGVKVQTQNREGETISWRRVESLQNASDEAKDFVYDNTTQTILFGDGEKGALSPKGETILTHYRVSEGRQGDVPYRIDDWSIDNLNFYNPKSIHGGEDIPNYKERFSTILKHWYSPHQAVTLNDYETLAKMTTGLRVARAKALADKDNNRITMVVVPFSRGNYPLADAFFCKRICRFLDPKRLITTRINVMASHYTPVGVNLHIKTHNNVQKERVRLDIITTINEYLHPLRGGDNKEGWEFGRGIYLSDIYALVELVKGVSSILDVAFYGGGEYDGTKKRYRIAKESLIETLNHRVTFQESMMNCGGIS